MMLSPLSLENYFFTRIHVEACNAGCDGPGDLSCEVASAHHKDNPRRWQITFSLKNEAAKDAPPPYMFDIEVVGLFKVQDDLPQEQVRQFAEINGSAVLYGSVREMISNLTGRGPHAPLLLPTMTFVDQMKQFVKDAGNTEEQSSSLVANRACKGSDKKRPSGSVQPQ